MARDRILCRWVCDMGTKPKRPRPHDAGVYVGEINAAAQTLRTLDLPNIKPGAVQCTEIVCDRLDTLYDIVSYAPCNSVAGAELQISVALGELHLVDTLRREERRIRRIERLLWQVLTWTQENNGGRQLSEYQQYAVPESPFPALAGLLTHDGEP